MSCPQCADNTWFERVGWLKHKDEFHEKAIHEANEYAKTWADSDEGLGCSLGWTDLWLHHFGNAYKTALAKLRKQAIDEYSTACYKKDYGDKNHLICGYHEEFR